MSAEAYWIIGFAWLLGMIILWGILYSSESTNDADPEEVERLRFKRYMEREVNKAWAGAANADQWANDLLKAWKEHK